MGKKQPDTVHKVGKIEDPNLSLWYTKDNQNMPKQIQPKASGLVGIGRTIILSRQTVTNRVVGIGDPNLFLQYGHGKVKKTAPVPKKMSKTHKSGNNGVCKVVKI